MPEPRPMKETELRQHLTCANCGRRIGHAGVPLFWRVTVDRFGLDLGAVQRQTGLTMLLGGSASLAAAMGANEDMARPVMDTATVTLCEPCGSGEQISVAELAFRANEESTPTGSPE